MGYHYFSFIPHPPLIFSILLVFLIIPSGFSNSTDWYSSCSTGFTCGNITAGHPFWGNNRSHGCGIPDMELRCQDGNSTIEIEGVTYRVLEIKEKDQILKIARQDYLDGICQPEFKNTSLNPDLFYYSSGYRNITIFYGCPPELPGLSNVPPISNCVIKGTIFQSVYAFWEVNGPGLCYRSVNVPIAEVIWSTYLFNLSFLQVSLKRGFEVKWKANQTACNDCISSNGACGHDLIKNRSTCYCPTGSNSCLSSLDTIHIIPGAKLSRIFLGIGLATVTTTVISIILVCYYCFTRRRVFWKGKRMPWLREKTKRDEKIEAFIMNYHTLIPKRYSYSDIKKITNSLNDKLGQGGYGGVYKGKLLDGRFVAVKVLIKSTGDGEEFINEVASICRTSHVNIVSLLGFCYEKSKRALIYEYMPNGSLDKFICDQGFQRTNSHQLDLKTLYDIATGIARGLEYLHRGCNTRIVHFDIKPHNILLDKDFCPKISDFGLAKLCKGRESVMSALVARGTAGYIAPEVLMRSFGGVSYKSDVYSYGMMILEIFGGRNNTNVGVSHTSEMHFPEPIYKYLESRESSILHKDITIEEEDMVRRVIIVGLWCIQTNPSDRPSMTKVVEMLDGSPQSMQLPPKPSLFSATPPESYLEMSDTLCLVNKG